MGPDDKNQSDDVLDGALKRYGDVEPRAGLEGRVLARLAEQHAHRHKPWVWALTAAALASSIAVIALFTSRPWKVNPKVDKPAVVAFATGTKQEQPGNQRQPISSTPKRRSRRDTTNHGLRVTAKLPRQERFPSARPLSEQEKLLVNYVTQFPKQAAQVAEEQSRRDKELHAMYPVPGPNSNQER